MNQIERVARAIAKDGSSWKMWRKEARAAIRAMRSRTARKPKGGRR